MEEKNPNHGTTSVQKKIFEAEWKWIKERRQKAGVSPGNPEKDCWALTFSGGGIRSAVFNLGILQGLFKKGVFKQFDYLSTVSGGGYIGSSLTWFKQCDPELFPFGNNSGDQGPVVRRVLDSIRAHGDYLTPDAYLNIWSFIAATITGVLVNLLILVPIFFAAVYGLSLNWNEPFGISTVVTGFQVLTGVALLLFCLFFVQVLHIVVISKIGTGMRSCISRRRLWHWMGQFLLWGILLLLISFIPNVYDLIRDVVIPGLSLASISSVGSILAGSFNRDKDSETRGWRSALINVGLSVLIYSLVLLAYFFVETYECSPDIMNSGLCSFEIFLIGSLLISVLLAMIANINRVSLHRFYRNRLKEAFMPENIVPGADESQNSIKKQSSKQNADQCILSAQKPTDAPYQIINTMIQTEGSELPRLRNRLGENFILTPKYCGSDHTKYVKTANFAGDEMNLATAMAISGAAVDPNTLTTRSHPLSFLMALLNIRLGYWITNPKKSHSKFKNIFWYYFIFKELFGSGLNENCDQIHLTDGGHFENLGLYEMVRRKCRHIVVCDVTADLEWQFYALANALEMIRVDFGATVDIDTSVMVPKDERGISPQPYAKGTITYSDNSTGELYFIKNCMIENLPVDVKGYRNENPTFPDQSTADQFFDERQFEAYRELGYQIGSIVGEKLEKDFEPRRQE